MKMRFGGVKPIRIEPHEPKNPLVSIWFEPRATLRFILSTDETLFVHVLAIFAMAAALLGQAAAGGAGDTLDLPVILIGAAFAAIVVGVLQLYLASALATFTGRFFGGRARFGEVRAAIAWGGVPLIVSLLVLWIPCLLIFGQETFTSSRPSVEGNHLLALISVLALLAHLVLIVWTCYTTIAAVSEAHQITRIRGALTLGTAALLFAAAVAVLVLSVYAVIYAVGSTAEPPPPTPEPMESLPTHMYAG